MCHFLFICISSLFGHPAPFDRHDWVVDRAGVQTRYIIDYYHNEQQVNADKIPTHLHDITSMKSIQVDVRPAFDSLTSIFDRTFKMPYQQYKKLTIYNPPPFFLPKLEQMAINDKLKNLNTKWIKIQTDCELFKNELIKFSFYIN